MFARFTLASMAGLVVSSAALAGDTCPLPQKRLTIGGPGTCGSDGFSDPGRLNDGITEASALFVFVFDPCEETLTLTVTNTSPVLVGVNNPLLTDIFFNCPVEVTGMDLLSQSSSGGVAPGFDFNFDDDLDSNPNPNGAAGFGAYSVQLADTGNVQGAIANPRADTYVQDPSDLAISPCTFVFSVEGDLDGMTSRDFKIRYSVVPPGSKVSTGTAKFQAGGDAEASGFITGLAVECFLLISSQPGDTDFTTFPSSHVFPTYLEDTSRYYGMNFTDPVTIPVHALPLAPLRRNEAVGFGVTNPLQSTGWRKFYVQGFLWNPTDFPTYPEQWTHGFEVLVAPDGTVTSNFYGADNGMLLNPTLITRSDGERFLRFPFTVTSG